MNPHLQESQHALSYRFDVLLISYERISGLQFLHRLLVRVACQFPDYQALADTYLRRSNEEASIT